MHIGRIHILGPLSSYDIFLLVDLRVTLSTLNTANAMTSNDKLASNLGMVLGTPLDQLYIDNEFFICMYLDLGVSIIVEYVEGFFLAE